MARKKAKSSKSKAGTRRKGAASSRPKRGPSVAEQTPAPSEEASSAAAKRYTRSLVNRGEAVPAGQPLPPGATHEVVDTEPDGTPVVKRRRFSTQ